MFGFSFEKLIVIAVIAVIVVGPARLPQYAARLAQFIKMLRGLLDTAKDRVREEMGPEFEDLDWKRLDPRQYDPRKIIRDALLDDPDPDPEVAVVRPVAPVDEADPSQSTPDEESSTTPGIGVSLTLVTDDDSVVERRVS
jgi:sec-independent protein translocase protein TatB